MEDIDPSYNKGMELIFQGRLEDAEPLLLEALERAPDNVELLCDLGLIYQNLEQWDIAEKTFRTATEKGPDNQQAWIKLGLVLIRQKKYEDAILASKKAIDLVPDNPFTWLDIGYCYYELGEWSDAEQAYLESQRLYRCPNLTYSWT
jgi:tetratricopeptide (TPR) repeat protein